MDNHFFWAGIGIGIAILIVWLFSNPAHADAAPHCSRVGEVSCVCGNAYCWTWRRQPSEPSVAPESWYTGDLWINGAIDYGFELGPIVQRMLKADMEKEKSK